MNSKKLQIKIITIIINKLKLIKQNHVHRRYLTIDLVFFFIFINKKQQQRIIKLNSILIHENSLKIINRNKKGILHKKKRKNL